MFLVLSPLAALIAISSLVFQVRGSCSDISFVEELGLSGFEISDSEPEKQMQFKF